MVRSRSNTSTLANCTVHFLALQITWVCTDLEGALILPVVTKETLFNRHFGSTHGEFSELESWPSTGMGER